MTLPPAAPADPFVSNDRRQRRQPWTRCPAGHTYGYAPWWLCQDLSIHGRGSVWPWIGRRVRVARWPRGIYI